MSRGGWQIKPLDGRLFAAVHRALYESGHSGELKVLPVRPEQDRTRIWQIWVFHSVAPFARCACLGLACESNNQQRCNSVACQNELAPTGAEVSSFLTPVFGRLHKFEVRIMTKNK